MVDSYTDTSTTNFDNTVTALVRAQIQAELRSSLVHMNDALRASWRPGTDRMRFISYRDLDVTTGTPTPGVAPWLTQGVAPSVEEMSIAYDEFQSNQAGRIIGLTDIALTESPHDLYAVAAERIGRNVAATVDKRLADVILAGTNVLYAGTSNAATADVAAGDVLTGANVKRAVATLKAANVPTFGDGYYHAIIHPAVVLDLQSDTNTGGWIDANKYTDNRPLLTGEIGRYAGVRFMESSAAGIKADSGTSSIDVYSTVFYGPDAFAFGDMQTIQTYSLRGPDKSDPLNQVAKVGWKAMFGAVLLDANGPRYLRYESASSL
jgi:N4-gp56 family major capsid protein